MLEWDARMLWICLMHKWFIFVPLASDKKVYLMQQILLSCSWSALFIGSNLESTGKTRFPLGVRRSQFSTSCSKDKPFCFLTHTKIVFISLELL